MRAIHEIIQSELDKVLKLQLLKNSEIQSVNIKKHRTFGRLQIELSAEEKAAMITNINQEYNNQIKKIYTELNEKLSDLNLKKLNNPFEERWNIKNEN